MKKYLVIIILLLNIFILNLSVKASEFINRIDINYDSSKVIVSPYYTYNQVKNQFSNSWIVDENENYSKGNNVQWMYYCPSIERCTSGYTPGYRENINAEKYTIIGIEVYAKDNYDFDKDNLNNIDVFVNGIKNDEVWVTEYSSSERKVMVMLPLEVDTSPFVYSVVVSNNSANVNAGETSLFKATVQKYGEGYDEVIWSIIGEKDENTTISNSGLLSVSENETASKITVRATSTKDNTKYGEKTVNIIREELTINKVTITSEIRDIYKGATKTLQAVVEGNAIHDINWSLSGNISKNTCIDNEGNLNIDLNESSTLIVVKAESVYDSSKYDTLSLRIKETEKITEVNINYDITKAPFNVNYTHSEWQSLFESNSSTGNGYLINYNNTFLRHNTEEGYKQTNTTPLYNDYISTEREYGLYVTLDPKEGYYFDPEDYQNVIVKVNNKEIQLLSEINYNVNTKNLRVFFPLEVDTSRAPQYLYFNMNEFNSIYGNIFTNRLFHQIGDGTIRYSSSNPEIALVNETTGQVTCTGVGQATITAVASKTENFMESSASYKVIVAGKSIAPIIAINNEFYTGSQIKPNVKVTYNNLELVKDKDYICEYGENINVGKGSVTIKQNPNGTYIFADRTVTFNILRKDLTSNNLIVPDYIIYTGEVLNPVVSVKDNDKDLLLNEDYNIEITNQDGNIGEYINVKISGINNYTGVVEKNILIKEKEPDNPVIVITPLLTPYISKKTNNNSIKLSWALQNKDERYYIERSTDNKKWSKLSNITNSSYTDKNLTYNKTYYYRVYAKTTDEKTVYSNVIKYTVKPNKVNLKISSASTNNVKLSWEKVSTTGYEVYMGTKTSNMKKNKTITKNSTLSFNKTKLKANTTYYFKVRAYKTVNKKKVYGPWSDILKVKTAPVKSKISVSLRDYNALNVKVGSSKGATRYLVYRSTSKTGKYTKIGEVASGTYKDLNLVTGKTYYYKVKACNSKYCSGYSNIASKKVIPKTPSLNLQSPETKVITVTLGEVNGADGYEVYRSTSKTGTYTKIKEFTDGEELIFDNVTKKGKTYYYKARSYTIVNSKKIYSSYTSIKSRISK